MNQDWKIGLSKEKLTENGKSIQMFSPIVTDRCKLTNIYTHHMIFGHQFLSFCSSQRVIQLNCEIN
jgi:hypothetical protein